MEIKITKREKLREVCNDILLELLSRTATNGWTTNYCYANATLNELNEI